MNIGYGRKEQSKSQGRGWFSLLAVGTRRSGAIVFRRVSMVARTSCFGSSTTDSRGLCCQHLGGRGRRHRAVENINVHVIRLRHLPSVRTCYTDVGWCTEIYLIVATSFNRVFLCFKHRFNRVPGAHGGDFLPLPFALTRTLAMPSYF